MERFDSVNSMTALNPIVFLVDVDNTLLDNDRIQDDLKRHIEREFGAECRDRFWAIQEDLFNELGYRDYLGALQRFRVEHPYEPHLMTVASFLVDYPFADRLYPGALDVVKWLRTVGQTVILSDGDVVFQPRKVQQSGLWEAVEGRVLIYTHKEQMLPEVARLYPARHYVVVDDKLRILAAMKALWGERLVVRVHELGHAQRVVQLKRGHVEVFERRDLDRGARGELVSLRQEFDVDLVVVHAQARFLGRQRRSVRDRGKKQAKKKDKR
jgi:FMN phosphatase YigB (HAD superfamily)